MKNISKAESVMRELWAAEVDVAQSNSPSSVEAAKDILQGCAEIIGRYRSLKDPEKAWSGPIPWTYAQYLAKCFEAIVGDADPARALNLVAKKRGRPAGKRATHDLEALAASWFLLQRYGLRAEVINAELGQAVGADRATLYRARKQHAYLADRARFEDEYLKVALKPYAAYVTAIQKRRKK